MPTLLRWWNKHGSSKHFWNWHLALNLYALNKQIKIVKISLFLFHFYFDFRGLVVGALTDWPLSETDTDKLRLENCECTCVLVYHVISLNILTPKLITEKKQRSCSASACLTELRLAAWLPPLGWPQIVSKERKIHKNKKNLKKFDKYFYSKRGFTAKPWHIWDLWNWLRLGKRVPF